MIDDLQIAALAEAAERLNARADQAVATAREAMRRLEAGDYAGVEALAERARIVAWLRSKSGDPEAWWQAVFQHAADGIESGEHLRKDDR